MTYESEVLADSPIHYLKFDETSGTSVANSGSSGSAFTSLNCVLNAPTVMPNGVASYDFPGTAEASLAASTGPTSFTVEAWVRPDVTSGFNAIAARDTGGFGWAFISLTGN